MTPARPAVPLWWLRTETADAVTLHAVASAEHPDGAVVDVASLAPGYAPPGERVVRARMRPATRQVLEVEVRGAAGPDAPAVVWHEQVRRDLRPLEVHLLAFRHDDVASHAGARSLATVPPGTVLTAADVGRLGLTGGDQLAAVRWDPATGQVLELYVDPGHRRRGVGTCLLLAAEACAVARGWPTLRGGGVRTELGEALRRGLRWGVDRFAPLDRVAPPMTPAGEEAGRLTGRTR